MNELLEKIGDFVIISAELLGNSVRQITLVTPKQIRQVITLLEENKKTALEISVEAVADGTKICINSRYTVI